MTAPTTALAGTMDLRKLVPYAVTGRERVTMIMPTHLHPRTAPQPIVVLVLPGGRLVVGVMSAASMAPSVRAPCVQTTPIPVLHILLGWSLVACVIPAATMAPQARALCVLAQLPPRVQAAYVLRSATTTATNTRSVHNHSSHSRSDNDHSNNNSNINNVSW